MIIREIGSFNFPGFYESIFSFSDEFVDDEYEMKFEINELIESDNFEVYYEYFDLEGYEKNICKKYMEEYVNKIIEVLPDDITEHEDFLFEIVDLEEIVIVSPQYYNYTTDKCFCNIKTNRKTLKLIKEYTLRLDGVKRYLLRHFTSCDGFISFISNDIKVWKELDIEDYEENMLIALLDMLIDLRDCTAFELIAMSAAYDVDKYYYAGPVIYYKEKNKEITEKDLKILKNEGYKVEIPKW